MAGRPKTMVKKVAPLEETAFQLYLDLYEMRPAQYAAREGIEGEDRLAWWWNEAARTVRTASMAVSILLGQLEERLVSDMDQEVQASARPADEDLRELDGDGRTAWGAGGEAQAGRAARQPRGGVDAAGGDGRGPGLPEAPGVTPEGRPSFGEPADAARYPVRRALDYQQKLRQQLFA